MKKNKRPIHNTNIVCNAIEKVKLIKETGEGMAELLVSQLKGGVIGKEALEMVNEDIERQANEEEESLKLQNPICSKIKPG